MPTTLQPTGLCDFCQAAPVRSLLAQALSSGQYQQNPDLSEDAELRDGQNRHTVTGVAADAVSPTVWVKLFDQWRAVWLDEISTVMPNHRSHGNSITSLTRAEELALERSGAGDSHGCPEITAHTLGLHDGHEHPGVITLDLRALPDTLRRSMRLPDSPNHPIDRLTFTQAAAILDRHQDTLGSCRCSESEDD